MARNHEQPTLPTFESPVRPSGPVTCLGMTFDNDEARRAHFTEELRKKLQDPGFRKIEGFPIGSDEDILNLSDPPYYTACPNPWIADFIAEWEAQKPEQPEGNEYHREPFAEDVSQGKGDTLYSAHSYHTKVPPQAIAKYILHYTNPGDVVLDAFAGSGMTGLASVLCKYPNVIDPTKSLKDVKWGERIPLLIDLSPVATFISSVYTFPVSPSLFQKSAKRILKDTELLLSSDWNYKNRKVCYFVHSEVFRCPECGEDILTNEVVKMTKNIGTANSFPCPHCDVKVSKAPRKEDSSSRLQRALTTEYDPYLKKTVPRRKEKIIAVMYADGKEPVFEIIPEGEPSHLNNNIINEWVPTSPLIDGDRFLVKDCCRSYGITHIHHFYTDRQIRYLSHLWSSACKENSYESQRGLKFFIQSYSLGATKMNRFIPAREGKILPGSQVNRYFSGTMYIPSLMSEVSPTYLYERKIGKIKKAFEIIKKPAIRGAISTQSAGWGNIPENSVDYIFVDPPFGQNLQYSELNQIWESWLRIYSNRMDEAVVDEARNHNVFVYGDLMYKAFRSMYKALKPGRWITIEFHNSLNSVWIAIQEGLFKAGFVVADVRTLDKQQDTYKQSRQGLVKTDLVISAYKPRIELSDLFDKESGIVDGAWNFVREHLTQLPIFVGGSGKTEVVVERQNFLLFDRMVAFHVQRGAPVPISSADFYIGLTQRFPERDGMFFLPEQVAKYDKKRMLCSELAQAMLFVVDEASAIQWLRRTIKEKPQTFQDIHPQFMREVAGWSKNEISLELSTLLEQNFLRYDGKGPVPEQIHAYLSTNWKELRNLPKDDPTLVTKARDRWYVPDPNKAGDLEKLREKALLKEFEEYKEAKKKLKVFRLEAVRAGFKKAWQQRDYAVIVAVADKIPNNVLEEDPKLLMWYDQAVTRMGGE